MHTRVFAAISSLQMIMLGKNKITVLTVVVIFGLQPAFERELCHSFFVVLGTSGIQKSSIVAKRR